MKLLRDKTYQKAIADAREAGNAAAILEPTRVYVAGRIEETRRSAMVRVKDPKGDRGRVHRIAGIEQLRGFRGGVLLCAHGTSQEIEDEARRHGMTLIDISWDGPQ